MSVHSSCGPDRDPLGSLHLFTDGIVQYHGVSFSCEVDSLAFGWIVSGYTGEDRVRNSYPSSRLGYMGKYPYEGPNERCSRIVNW